ncbi:MAG TPA: endolytic transglycosylase MltG [Lachnospiraceae bacterium]|nr:endolytic transglycosylase MltG [Lachnospiraceae bacterium]HEX3075498.1 endolytic transglycosylase MltG [Lachnospiraceae bacterium]
MATKSQVSKMILGITSFVLHVLLNIVFYIIVVMLITKYSGVAYDFAYELFGNVTMASEDEGKDVVIKIKDGESSMSVASKLELNRVIVNKYSFYLKAKLLKKNIQQGTYTVNTSMNYDEILDIITNYDNNQNKDDEKSDSADKGDKEDGSTE